MEFSYKNIDYNRESLEKKKSSYPRLQSKIMQIYLALLTKPKKILEIGIGNRFISSNLKKSCEVTTADYDKVLNPDVFLDISKPKDFLQIEDNSFDLLIICEVLEHVPYKYIDSILKSLKRIT